ncbi:DinB family protein, partial [Microbacteriaceae bacterium K1510]|nr:DinB family protein [Microbacteriaceae bacterium K1510]
QPVPSSAKEIADSFRQSSASFVRAIREQWTDDTLEVSCDMYGEQWPNGLTLRILIQHLIHHRGQMTVLMRQAGLQVPGVYGPSRDEWGQLGMEAPT